MAVAWECLFIPQRSLGKSASQDESQRPYDLRKKAWNPPPLSQVSTVNSSLWNWETLSAPRPLTTFIQVLPAVYPRTESKHTLPPDSELLMRRGWKGGQRRNRSQHLSQLSVHLELLLGTLFCLLQLSLPIGEMALSNQRRTELKHLLLNVG